MTSLPAVSLRAHPPPVELVTAITSRGSAGPIRYMGTKRSLAGLVRDAVAEVRPVGLVADLFSGVGSVAAALAPDYSIVANDVLSFTCVLARARFLEGSRCDPVVVGRALFADYHRCQSALSERFADRLQAETAAIAGGPGALREWMATAEHVGNSDLAKQIAVVAKRSMDIDRYALVSLYFGASYFSTQQAIALDALRYAIDRSDLSRDWLVGAWLVAAGRLVNAPGHTAQYLRPTSESSHRRICRQWKRSLWDAFLLGLGSLELVGTRTWRAQNRVTNSDAVETVASTDFDSVGLVYADPPYTKDHYSRFYHVYETMYRYDFPDSSGAGRYRSDRIPSRFSLASSTEAAFDELFRGIAARGLPVILSYPEDGLLSRRVELTSLLQRHFDVTKIIEVPLAHSTLGSSSGRTTKPARERIYVCRA